MLEREAYRTLDLRLSAGMDELRTLKSMSSLTFTSSHQNMEFEEIEWMVQTWPGMRRLMGKFSTNPKLHYNFKRYMNEHYVLVFDP